MTIRLTDEELEEMDSLIEFFENTGDDISCFAKIKNIIDYRRHIEDIDSDSLVELKDQLVDAHDFLDSINVNTDLIKKLIYVFSVV